MKKCKQGYYYCYKDKKCKRIPGGYRVGLGGYLRREKEEEKSEDRGETETKKNGNGNGNGGNGGNGNGGNGGGVSEAVMSPAQKRKDTMLKKKYDKSDMKQNMIDQYGKEEGTKIYFATIRKQAMKEGWSDKYKKSIDCDNPKGFSQKAHCQGRKKKMNEQTCPVCGFDPCQCLEGVITEKRDGKSSKDKGYSLRDWFKGGGWKQTGGKYDGKPCAKQPGQKTKPYCRDADDRAAMSKEERNKRAAKKRREDPNPNREGKAKNVTQESYSNWRQDLQEKPGDGYLGPTMKVGKKEYGVPNPIRIAQDAADNTNRANQRKVDAVRAHGGTASMPPYKLYNNQTSTASQTLFGMQKQSYEPEGEVVEAKDPGPGDPRKGHEFFKNAAGGMTTLNQVDAKIRAANKKKGEFSKEEVEIVDEGKKDACYHKVKSRYSVWPSAYASGALVKCRKVGAKNWGNKTKKEEYIPEFASKATVERIKREGGKVPSFGTGGMTAPNNGGLKGGNEDLRKGNKTKKEGYEFSNWRDDFIPTEYETTDLIKADPIQVPPSNLQKIEEAKKCWKGYKKVGTQKLFGKTYNRCEKIKKEHYDWRSEINIQEAIPGYEKYNAAVEAAKGLKGRAKIEALKAAAELRPKTEKEVNQKLGEDWQKSNRKDGVDGMSQKSVDAYRRENPGSKLKTAVTGKVKKGSKDAKRRKSFCSRSDGQRKMHNIDCKKTPDKKICKARRRWKC